MTNVLMIVTNKLAKTVLLSMVMVFTLIGCDADSANHAHFRATMNPLYAELEAGMSDAEVQDVIADYSDVENMKYPYDDELGSDFELGDTDVDGEIYQITMEGDPTESGVSSICFIKVLLVDDGEGGQHVLKVGDLDCPA